MSDGDTTDVSGFLRKLERGKPLNAEVTSQLLNRIYNILESLSGEGCCVEKPLDRKGLGWKIVVDGAHSDLEPAGRIPMPFELIAVDNAWHVWLLDAEVVLNNYHATKSTNLQTAGGGRWTASTFVAENDVYLYVLENSATATKHGPNCYTWNVAASVPTGALASVRLAHVTSATNAVQYVRGNQIFYTFANSEIITHDAVNAVTHIVTDSTSNAIPVDEHLAFVVREGSTIKYLKATDLLEIAYTKAQEVLRNPPAPDTPPSDIMPIGDETYDEWEARIKDAIRDCLVADHWPYMPEFSGESMYDADPSQFTYFGGWGVYDPVNDQFSSYWRGIDESRLRAWHIPGRKDLDEILRLMDAISDRIEEITEDPDGPQGQQLSLLDKMCQQSAIAAGGITTLKELINTIKEDIYTYDISAAEANGIITDLTARVSALDTRRDAIDDDVTALEGIV